MQDFLEKMWVRAVLGGLIRALVAWVGGWLFGHGLIDADTHERLLSEGMTDILGAALFLIAFGWSWLNKTKFVAKIKAALHLPADSSVGLFKATVEKEAPKASQVPLAFAGALLAGGLMFGTLSGCGSAGGAGKPVYDVVLDAAQITTPQKARNALGALQMARIAARDSILAGYMAGVITPARFEELADKDDQFTAAWRRAAALADLWEAVAGGGRGGVGGVGEGDAAGGGPPLSIRFQAAYTAALTPYKEMKTP